MAVLVAACASSKPEPPAPAPDFAGTVASFDKALKREVNRRQADVAICQKNFFVRNGIVDVGFTILHDGSVQNVYVNVDGTLTPPLAACLVRAVETWKLPPLVDGLERVRTSYPFRFWSDDAPGSVDEMAIEKLGPESIQRVVNKNIGSIQRCHVREMVGIGTFGGQVRVHFDIAPDGTVVAASAWDDTLGHPTMTTCILEEIQTWRFPKRKRGVQHVQYPFRFN